MYRILITAGGLVLFLCSTSAVQQPPASVVVAAPIIDHTAELAALREQLAASQAETAKLQAAFNARIEPPDRSAEVFELSDRVKELENAVRTRDSELGWLKRKQNCGPSQPATVARSYSRQFYQRRGLFNGRFRRQ